MANYTLTTSPQEVGRNTTTTVGARLLAWYSDAGANSAIVHLKLQAISQGTTYTGTNKDYQLVLGNTDTGTVAWSYAPLTADTWIDVREITQYVPSGGTVGVTGKVWTYVYGDAWITGNTVTLPVFATPPTGLAISNLTPGIESFNADVSVTSWGTNVGTIKYLELQCWTLGMNQPRRYQTNTTGILSTNITVDNDGAYTQAYGPLTIVGNTEYTIGAYSTNGNANTGSVNMGNATTLAYPATLSDIILTDTSVEIDYAIRSDGGKYDKTYEYSIDGGDTWTTFATVSGGSATSGSFNLANLTPGVDYTIKHRVTTTAGTANGTDFTFAIPLKNKFYGSVSDVATRVNKLYGPKPVVQTVYAVTGLTNNPNFSLGLFSNKYYNTYGNITVPPSVLKVVQSGSNTFIVSIKFADYSEKVLFTYSGAYTNQGAAWGFANNTPPQNGAFSSRFYEITTGYTAKEIKKLYMSVGGVAKRIY